jgi:riboflavin kinase / FMN adenylyltransferase
MKVFRSFEDARQIKNPVVTTGSFDGVHLGHKKILDRLRLLAEKCNGESVLITFDPHPRKVLYPDTAGRDLKLINSQEEKLELLEKAGLNNLIIIEFTREFSHVTSEQFVREFLNGILHAKVVVVGFNHHFGFNQEGDYKQLWSWQEKYNFEAEEIPEQEVQNEKVSSTKIRQAIIEGYIQKANAYLDHYYIIIGKTGEYFNNKSVDLPALLKVKITEECKLLPAPGIYAVSAESDSIISKAMAIITRNHEEKSEVLIDLFESHGIPTDAKFTIAFHKKIHGAVDLSDNKSVTKVKTAKAEIMDLIY